jgi:hypothetical protein
MEKEQLLAKRARLHRLANKYVDSGLIFMAATVRKELSDIDLILSEQKSIIDLVGSRVLLNR